VDLHNQNSTIVFQTNDNLKSISGTIIDTSNDASFVLMAKKVNMELDSFPDPTHEVKTSVGGGDHSQNLRGRSAYRDKLLKITKQVGNSQNSGVDVASAHGGDLILEEPSILLAEKTAEDYLEMS
jgi:hypothetical protein